MSGAYFADGALLIELGTHALVTPTTSRRIVCRNTGAGPARVMDAGGGLMRLRMRGECLRANRGDAERYAYEHLHALATSEPGTLGVEDAADARATFGQAVCVRGSARVRAGRFVELDLDLVAPECATQPDWTSPPAAPDVYPGTGDAQDYAAAGVGLGSGLELRVEMERRYPVRELPRARGARPAGPPAGALLRFVVTCGVAAGDAGLAGAVDDLARSIGPRAVDLTGNGNTYPDVVLASVSAAHTDAQNAQVRLTFEQELT